MMKTLYTAHATANGDGRNGHVRTDDGLLDLTLKMPKGLGGPGGATNPEQLFAAGYAACFHSALKLVARQQRIDIDNSTIHAHVHIGQDNTGGFGLAVTLQVSIPNVSKDVAHEAANAAYNVCPYSKATRGNIETSLEVLDSSVS